MNIHSLVVRAAAAERPDDKKEAILRAALKLFAERGFYGTAVPEIAEEAKVAAGTIYRYFEGKEALVNALFKRYKSALSASLMGDFPYDGTPREQFHHFFVRSMTFAKKEKLAFQFLEAHHHAPYLDDESRAIEERTLEPARAFFAQCERLKVTRKVAPEALGSIVWGGIVGLVKSGWEGRLVIDAKVEAAIEEALWDALKRPASERSSE
jgi:TetR/AcrR family transcriptional regulator, repressor of fatR-cypB operon